MTLRCVAIGDRPEEDIGLAAVRLGGTSRRIRSARLNPEAFVALRERLQREHGVELDSRTFQLHTSVGSIAVRASTIVEPGVALVTEEKR